MICYTITKLQALTISLAKKQASILELFSESKTHPNMPEKLETDPRPKVKELAKQFEFFQSAAGGKVPENVEKGYY